jgi:hypothetical protein
VRVRQEYEEFWNNQKRLGKWQPKTPLPVDQFQPPKTNRRNPEFEGFVDRCNRAGFRVELTASDVLIDKGLLTQRRELLRLRVKGDGKTLGTRTLAKGLDVAARELDALFSW